MKMTKLPVQWSLLAAWSLALLAGCGGGATTAPAGSSAPAQSAKSANLTAEAAVRAVIAEQFKVKADQISLDKPLSAEPLKADDLDIIELVIDTEERLDVSIEDEALDKAAGITNPSELTSRLTPRMLIQVAEQAPKGAPK